MPSVAHLSNHVRADLVGNIFVTWFAFALKECGNNLKKNSEQIEMSVFKGLKVHGVGLGVYYSWSERQSINVSLKRKKNDLGVVVIVGETTC